MDFPLQPTLENEKVLLLPLKETDFEPLYQVASDPRVWEQHPNRNRYMRDVFQTFFEGALQSGGAFVIVDKATNQYIGSTRFYNREPKDDSILIGYTFYAVDYWGKGYNPAVKTLMLNYIFQHVSRVIFHIGSENYRSQVAIRRLGAEKVGELEVQYFGESPKLNFVYEIQRERWHQSPC